MATWAVGDVQGCARTLRRLLGALRLARGDRVLFVGDLVNRGARSLEALRLVRDLGDRGAAVLGNHDLHLLEVAAGREREKRGDTLRELLAASDRDELLAWLRRRPLFHREAGAVLVHAGLHPLWTVDEAAREARRLEAAIRNGRAVDEESERFALDVFTRMRAVTPGGALCRKFTGPPRQAPRGCLPWFEVPGRRHADVTVVFGHWSALGLHLAPGLRGLDTGCVWGGTLTAIRLEDDRVVQEPRAREDRAEEGGD